MYQTRFLLQITESCALRFRDNINTCLMATLKQWLQEYQCELEYNAYSINDYVTITIKGKYAQAMALQPGFALGYLGKTVEEVQQIINKYN